MADKEVRVKIVADTSDIKKKLADLEKGLKDITSTMNKVESDSFEDMVDGINKATKEVDDLNEAMKETRDTTEKLDDADFGDLIKYANKLKELFSELDDNLDADTMNKKLTDIKDTFKELMSGILNRVNGEFRDLFNTSEDTADMIIKMTDAMNRMDDDSSDLKRIFGAFDGGKSGILDLVQAFGTLETSINTNNSDLKMLKTRYESLTTMQTRWKAELEHLQTELKEARREMIEFGKTGDSKGFAEAQHRVQNYNKQISQLRNRLAGVNGAIQNTKIELEEQEKVLQKTGDEAETFADKLKTAFGELKDGMKALDTGNFDDAMSGLKKSLKALMVLIPKEIKLIGLLTIALDKLKQAGQQRFFQGLEDAKKILQPLVNIGKTIGMELKTAFENITGMQLDLSGVIEEAVEFESVMAEVGAIAGSTGEELETLEATAVKWSTKSRYSAVEVGEAMTYMGMAGWNTQEILSGLEGVLNLATVGAIDLGQASDFVTDGLTALGMSAVQSNDFVDMLSATIVKSNTGVAQMQSSFENVAPIAGTLGVSMSDLSVTIGLMANQGVKAEKAGTALKNLLTNLSAPTKQMTAIIEKYNLGTAQTLITNGKLVEGIKEMKKQLSGLTAKQKTSVISTIAGKEALSGISALLNSSTSDINELKFAVDSSTKSSKMYAESLGLVDKEGNIVAGTFDKMKETQKEAYEQWENFNSILEECTDTMVLVGGTTTDLGAIIQKLGEDGEVTADQVYEVLDVFDKLREGSDETNKTLKKYGIEVKYAEDGSVDFGETLKNLGKSWDKLSKSEKEMLAEQLGFTGSIEELNELFSDNGEQIEELVDQYEEAKGMTERLAEIFDSKLRGSLGKLKNAILGGVVAVFEKITPAVQSVIDTFAEFFRIWSGLSEKIEGGGLGKALEWLAEKSKGWGEAIKNGLSSAISSLDEFINGGSFDNVLEIGTNIIDGICDGVAKAKEDGSLDRAIDGFIKKISKWIQDNAPKLKETAKTIINSISNGLVNNRGEISSAFDEVWDLLETLTRGKEKIFRDLGFSCGSKFVSGAIDGFIYDKLTWVGESLGNIVSVGLGFLNDFFDFGLDLADSIMEGWLGSETWQQVKDDVQEVVDWIQSKIDELYRLMGIKRDKEGLHTEGKYEASQRRLGDDEQTKKEIEESAKASSQIYGQTATEELRKEGIKLKKQAVGNLTDAKEETVQVATELSEGVSEALVSKLESLDAEAIKELRLEFQALQGTVNNVANNMSTDFETLRGTLRESFLGITNICRNQMLNMTNIVKNQCLNMRTEVVDRFISIKKVIRTQLTESRTVLVEKFISMKKVVTTQTKEARDNLTRQFISMRKVTETQMTLILRKVNSTMNSVKNATNREFKMKFTVDRTVNTSYTVPTVKQGMLSTMASMSSNMMTVGKPSTMALSNSLGGGMTINDVSGSLALEIPLYLDGKEIARASAKYNQAELEKLSKRKSRKRGE